MTKQERMKAARETWSEARRLTLDALEADQEFYLDESRRQQNATAREFRGFFDCMTCDWDMETGKITGLDRDGTFSATDEQLLDFAKYWGLFD